jgi:hypothetical protein
MVSLSYILIEIISKLTSKQPKKMQKILNKNSDHLVGKSDIREVKAERKREINFLNWVIWFEMAVIVALLIHHSYIH